VSPSPEAQLTELPGPCGRRQLRGVPGSQHLWRSPGYPAVPWTATAPPPPWPSPTWLANVTRAARPRGGTRTARRR